MREILYDVSLAIIIVTAVCAVAHPRVHTGIFGGAALSILAGFSFAGFEYDVANWRLGQTVAGAVWCLCLVGRWWRKQATLRQRLIQVCHACPLHEDR